jgi:hypothetical protein
VREKRVRRYCIQILMAFSRKGKKAIYIMFPHDILIISSITSRNDILHLNSAFQQETTRSDSFSRGFKPISIRVSFYKETS